MSIPDPTERKRGLSALVLLVLVAIVLGLFSPALFRGEILAPFDVMKELAHPWNDGEVEEIHNHFVSDAILQYLPYRSALQTSYREDGYIGWSDDIFGGRPLCHNTMTLPYAVSNQLFRALPFWSAWHLGIMLEFLIAGLGMWFLVRQRGATVVLALMVAIAWMLNAQFVAWIYHRWALSSFCWVAWILFFAERAMTAPPRRWLGASLGAAVSLALALFGGTLQHNAFVALVMAGYSIGWLLDSLKKEPDVAWRRVVPVLAVVGIVGLGLSGLGWLTALQGYIENGLAANQEGKLGYSIRAQGGDYSTPIKNVLSYPFTPFPWPMGVTRGMDYWKIFDTNLFYLNFYGFLPTLLAPFVFFFRTIPWRVRLIFLMGAVLPLTPLRGILYNRVNLLMIFAGCWIFAEGLSRPLPALFRKVVRWVPAALGVGIALWLIVSLVMTYHQDRLLEILRDGVNESKVIKRFGLEDDWMEERMVHGLQQIRIWDPTNLIALATAMLGSIALVRYLRGFKEGSRARGPVMAVLLGCVLIEGTMGFHRWVSWSPRVEGRLYVEDPEIVAMKELVGDGMLVTGTDYSPRWRVPFPPNILSIAGVRTLEGFDSIWVPSMWQQVGGQYDPQALAKIGVTHWLEYEGFAGPGAPWELVRTRPGYRVYAYPDPAPYAAVRSGEGSVVAAPLVVRKTKSTRRVEVPAGAAGAVHLLENWHEGWRFREDGGPWRPAERGAAGNLVLPLEGAASKARTLELQFKSPIVKRGLFLTLGSLVVLVGGLAVAGGTRRAEERIAAREPQPGEEK